MPPFLLGVSLSLQDRALGGAYTFAHGKRPAFFVLRCHYIERDIHLHLNPVAASCAG